MAVSRLVSLLPVLFGARLVALAAVAVLTPAPLAAAAQAGSGPVFLTRDEALALAFPGAKVERRTVVLSEEDRRRAAALAGEDVEMEARLVYVYEAWRDNKLVGTAYFDAHKVRTLQEVLMFAVDEKDRIARVEMLSFAEPVDYIPRGNWYGQFVGKRLDEDLKLNRGIRGVTGATLTATATTRAARRTLALHQVQKEKSAAESERRRREGGSAPR